MELDLPTTWSTADVCAYLAREAHWVNARCRLPLGDPGRIPNVKMGRDYRFSPRQVIDWFEAQSRWSLDMTPPESAA